jgi:hypothetical protein
MSSQRKEATAAFDTYDEINNPIPNYVRKDHD